MICKNCQKDALDCPCDIEFPQSLLRVIEGNICPNCEERVYSNGVHICGIDDIRQRHDSTLCFRCLSNVHLINNQRLKIPDDGSKIYCQCEEPQIR